MYEYNNQYISMCICVYRKKFHPNLHISELGAVPITSDNQGSTIFKKNIFLILFNEFPSILFML